MNCMIEWTETCCFESWRKILIGIRISYKQGSAYVRVDWKVSSWFGGKKATVIGVWVASEVKHYVY